MPLYAPPPRAKFGPGDTAPMRRLCFVLALTLLPGAAQAEGEVCAQNGADADYLFTVENAAGARARATLSPGAELCLSAVGAGGVVAVFERADSIEGCSRLVGESGRHAFGLWRI